MKSMIALVLACATTIGLSACASRGETVGTVGGAVAGGVIGPNVGRDRDDSDRYDRDVRRCEGRANAEPDYWNVTYDYRNVEHYVKMTAPPGRYIYVNRNGEPRQ